MPSARTVTLGAVLTALVALGPISTDMYLPSLPALRRAFASDVAMVQLTLSVFIAGFGVAQLIYGPLSDRFGRRPVLLAGVALFLLASVACALAQSVPQLVLARLFQAVGACAGPVLGRAVVRDLYGRERAARALAYIGTAMGLVPAAAPILGGYLALWFGWRATFVFLAGYGVVVLALVWLVLRETNEWREPEALRPRRLLGNYRRLLGDGRYIGYVLTVAFSYATLFAFLSGGAFVLIDFLGVRPERFGLFFAVIVSGYMAGTLFAGRLTLRLGLDRMIAWASLAGSVICLAMAALAWSGVDSVAAVIAPMTLYMAAMGIILPNGLAGAVGPYPRMAGAASAMLGFVQMAMASLAGVAVGLFDDGTQRAMITTMAVTAFAAFAAFHLMVRRWRAEPRAADAKQI